MTRSSILVVLILALAGTTEAQRLGQYARASVESPLVLARGGTAVAWPSTETALFYNPAHLARIEAGTRIEILSVQGSLSDNFLGNVGFLLGELQDAAKEGISLPLTSSERVLFEEALRRGRRATVGKAAVALPVVFVATPAAGFGGGLFAANTTRLRFEDIGGGIPLMDFFSQLDVIAAAGVAAVIPGTPVAAGTTVRVAGRHLASKYKDLLSLDPQSEQIYVFAGSTLAIDLGLHADDIAPDIPGELSIGIAIYDALGGGFSYQLDRVIGFTGSGTIDQREVDRILAALDGRDGAPTVRLGAAYRLPAAVGPLANVTIGADWLSARTSELPQVALTGLRLGAEASIQDRLTLRLGLGQGYPAAGVGFHLGGFAIAYCIYGVEEGRVPGQRPRYDHVVRLRVGIF